MLNDPALVLWRQYAVRAWPTLVLIDPEGSAKVTDFGIARSLDEEGLTADGRVLGTTDYVSP